MDRTLHVRLQSPVDNIPAKPQHLVGIDRGTLPDGQHLGEQDRNLHRHQGQPSEQIQTILDQTDRILHIQGTSAGTEIQRPLDRCTEEEELYIDRRIIHRRDFSRQFRKRTENNRILPRRKTIIQTPVFDDGSDLIFTNYQPVDGIFQGRTNPRYPQRARMVTAEPFSSITFARPRNNLTQFLLLTPHSAML